MPRKKQVAKARYGDGGIRLRGRLYWAKFRAWEDPMAREGRKQTAEVSTGEDDREKALSKNRDFLQRVEQGDYHWERPDGRWLFRWGRVRVPPGLSEIPTCSSDVTFEHMTTWFIDDYRAKGRKMLAQAEAKIRNHLAPFFKGMKADEIRAAHVHGYVSRRREESASAATINRELAILRRMFSIGMEELEILERRPRIRTLPEQNVRQGFLERQDLERLLAALPEYLRPPVSFAYETGWRMQSEVLKLEWANVDLEAREVRLWPGTTKTGAGRVLHLSEVEYGILAAQAATKEWFPNCSRVFHNAGRPITNPTKAWNRAREAAGLPHVIRHDMRRSAVRNLVRAGVSEKLAMERTGHRTRSVFDRYDISSDRDRRAVAQALDRAHRAQFGDNLGTAESEHEDATPVTH